MFDFLDDYRDVAIDASDLDGVVLTCRLREGLSDRDIPVGVPLQARELWRRTSGGVLMRDLSFGVCGLTLYDPGEAKKQTADRAECGYDVTAADWVVGDFIGDTDMLIIDENSTVLISTGSYARKHWYVFTSLEDVLKTYIEVEADKYWENPTRSAWPETPSDHVFE